jgi:lipid-A-disaccharide synthase
LRRVMIVAGEASGDMHGAALAAAARELDPELSFFGMGGERMAAQGVELRVDLEHMAIMGVTEVFSGLGQVLSALRTLKEALVNDRPEALVLIDYPDFNLRLAKAAHKAGVPVFYYICPQIWAWRTGRIKQIAKWVDRRVVVFPFEPEFYQRHGSDADFVGHPLLDSMEAPRPKDQVKAEMGFDPEKRLLLLMPGSRKHLAALLAPVMLETAAELCRKYPDLQLALARADTLPEDFLSPMIQNAPKGLKIFNGASHALQNAADAAIVASGTSTVETALMLTPMVVVYRMSGLSFFLGRMLVDTKHVAMANLIARDRIVPELLQYEANPETIGENVARIFDDETYRQNMIQGLALVRKRLGEPGASRRAAELLLDTMTGGGMNKETK